MYFDKKIEEETEKKMNFGLKRMKKEDKFGISCFYF